MCAHACHMLPSQQGADGRLTQQERQCCINQKLCLFCGKPGHMAKDCNKASAAKAHTALVTKEKCHGCNTKSTRYSGYSGNVPGLHILLQVELLTPFTSGLPFLLCSSFVLTLLIREHCLVILSFCSIVLCSQTYLRSKLQTPCCPLSGYSACCAP